MAGLAAEAGRIRDLAAASPAADPQVRRLLQFLDYQSFACLWLLVPGSVDDADSPFNGCAHAYLAGTQALMVRLQAGSAEPEPLRAMAARIAARERAAIPLCRFSGDGFHTGTIVAPDWGDIPRHPALVGLLAGTLLGGFGFAWAAAAALRRLPARSGAAAL